MTVFVKIMRGHLGASAVIFESKCYLSEKQARESGGITIPFDCVPLEVQEPESEDPE